MIIIIFIINKTDARFPLHSFGYYFIEPVIAMLDPLTGEPFVGSCDNIGCPMVPKDFALTGTCNEELYGMCEQLWEPNLVRLYLCLLPLALFHSPHSLLTSVLLTKFTNNRTPTLVQSQSSTRHCAGGTGALRDHLAGDAERARPRRRLRLGRHRLPAVRATCTAYSILRTCLLILPGYLCTLGHVPALCSCSEKDKVTVRTLKARMD